MLAVLLLTSVRGKSKAAPNRAEVPFALKPL
jgi:hypothetical protein